MDDTEARSHAWRFFRAGGFDQVRIDDGQDMAALPRLDQKLWVALACPVTGLEFDAATLKLIDVDGDGRIRAPEVLAAVKFAAERLKSLDLLVKPSADLALSDIAADHARSARVLLAARRILSVLADPMPLPCRSPISRLRTRRLGPQSSMVTGLSARSPRRNPAVQALVTDILTCVDAVKDRWEKPGLNAETLDAFVAEAQAFDKWWSRAEAIQRFGPSGRAPIVPQRP